MLLQGVAQIGEIFVVLLLVIHDVRLHASFLLFLELDQTFFLFDLIGGVFQLFVQFFLLSSQSVQSLKHGLDRLLRRVSILANVSLSSLLPLSEHYHLVCQHLHILNHVVHVARHFLISAIELGLDKSQIFSLSDLLVDLGGDLVGLVFSLRSLLLVLRADQVEIVVLTLNLLVLSFKLTVFVLQFSDEFLKMLTKFSFLPPHTT